MDTLPLHPKFVHLPIALSILVPLVALGVALAWWRDKLPRRAWWIVVGLAGVLFASGMYARSTGEADEERVEAVVPEAVLERHEAAAATFVIGAGVALALAIGAAVIRPRPAALATAAATVIAGAVVLGLGYQVGQVGGELVYRHGAAAAFATPPPAAGGDAAGPGPRRTGEAPPRDDDD